MWNVALSFRIAHSECRTWEGLLANAFDLIVLGGGPAGYVAAIRAAQLGMAVAVIERDKLGGVCVNIGCIPTKALLHSSYLAHALRDASQFGIDVGEVKTNYGTAMTRSRRVADQNSKGVEFLMKKNKVTVVKGTGVLQPGRKVKVGGEVYEARKAVMLATGSRVKGIPQIGLEINKTTVISSDEALFLEKAPASMAIIGAGAVGMEFADIFNAFGTQVTLIEALPRILPLEDAEASYKVLGQMATIDLLPDLAAWKLVQKIVARINPKVAQVDINQLNNPAFVRSLEESGFLADARRKLR